MDLIKSAAKRSQFSEIVYIILNVVYAALIFGLTIAFTPPYLAYIVVILSKWRVFAVRPRFWFANLQTNMVDLQVGLSVVTLMWLSGGTYLLQVLLAVLFVAWLLLVKPRSKRKFVVLQAGISQFVSLMALYSFAHEIPLAFVVFAGWLTGYVCARHALEAYNESELMLTSLAWGLVTAEFSWLAYHWMIAYQLAAGLAVPQMVIFGSLISFLAMRLYDNYHHNDQQLKINKLRGPIIFVALVIVILLSGEVVAIFRHS